MDYNPIGINVKGYLAEPLTIAAVVLALPHVTLPGRRFASDKIESLMIEFLKLGGGIAGIIALTWRVFEVFKSYLQIELEIQKDEDANRIHVITAVENKSYLAKTLDAAFLIIGPENEMPDRTVHALRALCPQLDGFETLNQMVTKVTQSVCHDSRLAMEGLHDKSGRAIIPLTYYYWENIRVGDERLTCSHSINIAQIPSGAYAVRFYVEPKYRYYRSVQRGFAVPASISFNKQSGKKKKRKKIL